MSGPMAARNTCFALISAIEEDFRVLIQAISNDAPVLPADVRQSALRRRVADLRSEAAEDVRDSELLPYIDFGDIAKVLDSKLGNFVEQHRVWCQQTAGKLITLVGARNRVCHSRPLEIGDLPSILDFSGALRDPGAPFSFPTVAEALKRLSEQPSFALTVQIPSFWMEKQRVHHNLPIPEFDDTGFVGRQTDRMNVLKLLKSHYPVVTLVGAGGIGKTALALRCLYDLLDDQDEGFDAVIWVSLKTAILTQSGVRQLSGAITSTLGLLSALARELGAGGQDDRDEAKYIDEIVEYLSLYRIIIAIDNLETISVGPLRELLARIPAGSKVLLTSRLGVGEFEARYPVEGLEERAAISLFRAFAKILSVSALQKLDDGNIKGYCRQLFFSPLLIKWFVACVARGVDANRLVGVANADFSEALAFCFRNLFERLGASERAVIDCLTSARRPLTAAELHFLMSHLPEVDIEFALIALHNSSVVNRAKKGSDGFEYTLSDSTATFVAKFAQPAPQFFRNIQERLRELRTILSDQKVLEGRYAYDPYFVRVGEGRDERICATYLRRALDHLKKTEFDPARTILEEAKLLASQSSEVWRIAALIEVAAGEHYKAYECFEHAIDFDPRSKIARYGFGMFLMVNMEDVQGALIQFNAALKEDPESAVLLTQKAVALLREGSFEESAKIHEELLKSMASRERRWRLSGTDQAADCYRRWLFRAWEQKELEQAKRHALRAIEIIKISAMRHDIDGKILTRTAKILNDALCRRELIVDEDFVNALISEAERIRDLSPSKSIPVQSNAFWAVKGLEGRRDVQQRLLSLDRSAVNVLETHELTPVEWGEVDVKVGAIDTLHDSFGFVACDDGRRWFFHRSSVSAIDGGFEALQIGSRIAFRLGKNNSGDCAIDVRGVE